jgi:hypothetical protein
MQIFEVHEFGPPSSELEPPLSGKVSGGNVNGGVPPSSPESVDPSSPGVVASPDGALESSGPTLPPPLPLPPPLALPPPDPEQVVHESSPLDGVSPELDPVVDIDLVVNPGDGREGSGDVAQPAAAKIAGRASHQSRRSIPPFSRWNRFTPPILTVWADRSYVLTSPMSCHFRPSTELHSG